MFNGSWSYDAAVATANSSRFVGFFERSAIISRFAIESTQTIGYQAQFMLPLTVLRRPDRVPARTKEKVLKTQAQNKGKLENQDQLLCSASGFAYSNTSRYDFNKLLPAICTWRETSQLDDRFQPEHARGAREVQLRQHYHGKIFKALNENPGKHRTPRVMVHLMVDASGRRGNGEVISAAINPQGSDLPAVQRCSQIEQNSSGLRESADYGRV